MIISDKLKELISKLVQGKIDKELAQEVKNEGYSLDFLDAIINANMELEKDAAEFIYEFEVKYFLENMK